MTPGGIKNILARQREDHARRRGRLLRNLVTLILVAGLAYGLERSLAPGSRLLQLAAHGEVIGAGAAVLLTATLCAVVALQLLQILDMRREMLRRRMAEAQAVALAFHDPLTGLPNRLRFEDYLGRLKSGQSIAVVLADLDGLKEVNDIFGHGTGDEVMSQAARRITTACGRDCMVARFGGSEFAIASGPLATREDAAVLAEAIVLAFEEPFRTGTTSSHVDVSAGLSLLKIGERPGAEALREAGLACHSARDGGYTSWQLFDQSCEDELKRRKTIEARLREAVASGGISPHYQPLVDLRSSEVIGFEALARWHDADLGAVAPEVFIPVAEGSGLIGQLSDHLLRSACRDAVEWPAHLKLSFNLSAVQFRDGLIGLKILSVLGETGLSPHRLEIEVTESCLVHDAELAAQTLRTLRDAGVRIAIDDFGTGYSNLYQLRALGFDNLKIDRSFIGAMDGSSDSTDVVSAILNLSRVFGLPATAEGIESEQQLQALIACGCEHGQGFLFGKAAPQAGVLKLITENSAGALSA